MAGGELTGEARLVGCAGIKILGRVGPSHSIWSRLEISILPFELP